MAAAQTAELLALAVVAAALIAVAAPAGAREPLPTVVQDDAELLHRSDAETRQALERLRALGVDRVRVTASWSELTRAASAEQRPDFDATAPAAYEQWRWRALDRLVRLAPEYGLETMVDIGFWAPAWAAADRGERARTAIDASAYRDFAVAVVRRYDGTFAPPPSVPPARPALLAEPPPAGRPLPRVETFSLWNEPNHKAFLLPQWTRRDGRAVPASPHAYRRLVAPTYAAIKAVRPDAQVLIGGLAAVGSYRNAKLGVPPLLFLREMACVDGHLRPIVDGECADFQPVPGDGLTHHPYSLQTTPAAPSHASHPDDARLGDLPRLLALLDGLAAAGRIAPALRDVYITEYGYETNASYAHRRRGAAEQARMLPWAEYLAWRSDRVKLWAQFLLRDVTPTTPASAAVESARRPPGTWQSGLLFADGREKLAYRSFAAALHAETRNGRLLLWGRLRAGARETPVIVEERHGAGPWTVLATTAPGAPASAASFVPAPDGTFLRTARKHQDGARYRFRTVDDTGRASRSVAPIARCRCRLGWKTS